MIFLLEKMMKENYRRTSTLKLKVTGFSEELLEIQENRVQKNGIFDDSNKVFITGIIESEFEFSHEFLGERFYKTKVRVQRLSGEYDLVPIIVNEKLIKKDVSVKNKFIEVMGQFRSFKKIKLEITKRMKFFLLAKKINIYDNYEDVEFLNANVLYLDGYVCQTPFFKVTPNGIKITELHLDVHGKYGTYIIPCIAWGYYAVESSDFPIGKKLRIYGRIQSRIYFKKDVSNPAKDMYIEVYEVSIIRMEESKN